MKRICGVASWQTRSDLHSATVDQISSQMKSLQQKPAVRAHKATYFTSVRPRASAARHQQQQARSSSTTAAACGNTRRSLLAGLGVSTAGLSFLRPLPAAANPLEDIARQITRPADITPLDAAVALLDARATLRDMSPLVSSSSPVSNSSTTTTTTTSSSSRTLSRTSQTTSCQLQQH
jgi:hypothetical protein